VAAFVFGADHKKKKKLFGYILNTVFYLWNLLLFAFEPQVNKKQLQFVLQTVDKGTQYKEKKKSKNRRKKVSFSISGEQLPFTTGLCCFYRQPDITAA